MYINLWGRVIVLVKKNFSNSLKKWVESIYFQATHSARTRTRTHTRNPEPLWAGA